MLSFEIKTIFCCLSDPSSGTQQFASLYHVQHLQKTQFGNIRGLIKTAIELRAEGSEQAFSRRQFLPKFNSNFSLTIINLAN